MPRTQGTASAISTRVPPFSYDSPMAPLTAEQLKYRQDGLRAYTKTHFPRIPQTPHPPTLVREEATLSSPPQTNNEPEGGSESDLDEEEGSDDDCDES